MSEVESPLRMFKLSSKDAQLYVPAKNREEAFAKFFLAVKRGEISLDQLGCLVVSHEGETWEEAVPFRTVPTLWMLRLISMETATHTLREALELDVGKDELMKLVLDMSVEDEWIMKEIRRLEEVERYRRERVDKRINGEAGG